MRRAPLLRLLVGVALVLGACSDGSVGDADWSLEGMSPSGDRLVVAVPFGGVASGCTRFEGWEVAESDTAVTVRARLWRRDGGDCTDELVVETLEVDLADPLGDRVLRGCGRSDCLGGFAPYDSGLLDPGTVTIAGATIVVQDPSGMRTYDTAGRPLSSVEGSVSGVVLGLDDGTVVRTPSSEPSTAVAHDAATGAVRWRAVGWTVGAGATQLYLCRGEEHVGLVAVDPATGADRWTSALPCDVVEIDDRLIAVTHDPAVDGGHRLLVGDAVTGAVLVDEAIDDGTDDQVTGFDALLRWGDVVVAAGPGADLVVIDTEGREVERWGTSVGWPVGVAAGDVLLSRRDGRGVFAHHLGTGAPLWELDAVDPSRRFAFDAGRSFVLDADGRRIDRIDPETGQPRWSVTIGAATGFDAAVVEDLVVLATPLALLGIDEATGEIRWTVDRTARP
ncbi:MAG: PQQ-binding-like beta-propeller repeat protein [Actinomycetota bacterium]